MNDKTRTNGIELPNSNAKIDPETGIVYEIRNTHISEIKPSDTIMHHGEMKTVCRSNIRHNSFTGITLFGDSYMLGHEPVEKVIIYRYTSAGWVVA